MRRPDAGQWALSRFPGPHKRVRPALKRRGTGDPHALAVLRSQREFGAQGASAPAWEAGIAVAWLVTLGLNLVMRRRAR